MTYFLQNDHHFLNRADSKTDLKKKKKKTNKQNTYNRAGVFGFRPEKCITVV